jgi:hypothetical protein
MNRKPPNKPTYLTNKEQKGLPLFGFLINYKHFFFFSVVKKKEVKYIEICLTIIYIWLWFFCLLDQVVANNLFVALVKLKNGLASYNYDRSIIKLYIHEPS